jgi:8-oxo-dGTP pyrophosphatase MutT (NUDIX family)
MTQSGRNAAPASVSAAHLAGQLADYRQRHPGEEAVVDRFFELIGSRADCFERSCLPGHVTGSAWLIDAGGAEVLLTHHRKLDLWVQLGGHSDGDPDTCSVARREAEEESGLEVELLLPGIFDLDIHTIPARRGEPAHLHFDVRYAFVSRSGRNYRVSDESHDLAWVPITDVHRFTGEASMLRMARKWLAGCPFPTVGARR